MSSEEAIVWHSEDDPEILQASASARDSFRFYWYQLASDFNRIVPLIDLSCLKVAFSDDFSDDESPVEHMWVEVSDFDGTEVSGVLLNPPDNLTSVDEGDSVSFPLSRIGDWICVIDSIPYGAYTIQVLRSRMTKKEQKQHDKAWGVRFPDVPKYLVPPRNPKSEAALAELAAQEIKKNPQSINDKDEHGRTPLHLECLYGRTLVVKTLLAHGASISDRCNRGWTAMDYASALNWSDIMELVRPTA